MGVMKDRNGMDLTEAKDGKKRWQEYIEEQYKKDLHDPWLYCAEDMGQAPRRLPRDLGRGTPDGFPSLPHPEGPLLCLPSPLHPQDLHGQRLPLGVSLEDRGGPREWRGPRGRRALEDGGGPGKVEGTGGWGGSQMVEGLWKGEGGGMQRMGTLKRGGFPGWWRAWPGGRRALEGKRGTPRSRGPSPENRLGFTEG